MLRINSLRCGSIAVSTVACVAVALLLAIVAPGATAAEPKPGDAEQPPKPGAETPAAPVEFTVLPVANVSTSEVSRIKKILMDGKFADDDEKTFFDNFFLKNFFPSWTQPKNRTQLRTQRDIYLKQYQTPAKLGEPRKHLNDVSLKALTDLAVAPKRPYDPAVRVNAMLLLGDLNAAEPALGNPNAVPTPLPEAVPVMLGVLPEPKQPDAVKVAAMVGIVRHLRMGGMEDGAARQQLSAMMLDLVKAAAPPAGRTAEGHAWMRGQAAEILGELGQPGANGAVPNALAAIVTDSKAPFSLRCAAARALGRLKYQAGGNLDPAKWALGLCQLAVDACLTEEGQTLNKRRIKERICAAEMGLSGKDPQRTESTHTGIMVLMTSGPGKTLATAVQAELQAIQGALDNRRLSDDDVLQKILDSRAKLQALLPKK